MTKGIIKAEVTGGKYAGKHFTIKIGKRPEEIYIQCNGKDISDIVTSIHLHIRANKPFSELIIITEGE